MSLCTARRGATLVAVVGMLLTAALGWSTQAKASTLYACAKKSGNAHIYAKKPKCKKGETKLSWNTAGPAGKNGKNGGPGANGTNGTNGTNGQDLTSHTQLPSGQSESGFFGVGAGASASGEVGEGVSFSQPLAAGLTENHVVFNLPEATSPHCPGIGRADAGFMCLYTGEIQSLSYNATLNFPTFPGKSYEFEATGKFGFVVYFKVLGSAGFTDGVWTVTAP
jgi:hypothetical protein